MWLKLFLLFSILSISSCRYYVNDNVNNKNGLNSKNNNNNNEIISSQHQNGQGGVVDGAKMFNAFAAGHEIMNSIKVAADDTASDAMEIQHQQDQQKQQQYGRVKRDYENEKWHEKAERWTITFILLAVVLPIVICCIMICIVAVIIYLCTRAAKPPPPQQQPIIIQRY